MRFPRLNSGAGQVACRRVDRLDLQEVHHRRDRAGGRFQAQDHRACEGREPPAPLPFSGDAGGWLHGARQARPGARGQVRSLYGARLRSLVRQRGGRTGHDSERARYLSRLPGQHLRHRDRGRRARLQVSSGYNLRLGPRVHWVSADRRDAALFHENLAYLG